MDHSPLPTRTQSPALRWVVALLLLVAGGAGLVPVVEADEMGRVQAAAAAGRHAVTRRRAQPRTSPVRPRRRPIAALVARVRPLLAIAEALRAPPRTPCVVALT